MTQEPDFLSFIKELAQKQIVGRELSSEAKAQLWDALTDQEKQVPATAPPLHHHCTTTAPPLHPTAPPLHCHCTVTAPPLHRHCTTTAPPLHHHCTTTALPLHRHCTTTAPPLHHHCTATAPPLYNKRYSSVTNLTSVQRYSSVKDAPSKNQTDKALLDSIIGMLLVYCRRDDKK